MTRHSCISLVLLTLFVYGLDSTSSCGVSLEKHIQARIIGGTDVGYYKYPWYGILKINGNMKCGCTMISDQFAITAASCFRDFIPVKPNQNLVGVFTVTLGIYDKCNDSESTRKTFPVVKITINNGFVKGKRANNLALLKLASSSGFEPACLPSKPITGDSRPSEGIVTGLGMVRYQPIASTCTLHEGRVLIYNDQQCTAALSKVGEDPGILNTTFCAGGVNTTQPYGCGLDLGGPLAVTSSNGSWYIYGIITFKKCPQNDNITLYQDVSKYLDWIWATIGTTPTPTPTPTPTSTTPDDYDDDYYDDQSHKTSSQPAITTTTTTTSPFPSIIDGPAAKRHQKHRHGKQKRHLNSEKHDHKDKKHHEKKHHKKHHEQQ